MLVAEQHQSSVANMPLRALREQERVTERYVHESRTSMTRPISSKMSASWLSIAQVDVAEMRLTEGRTEKLAETLMEEVLKEIRCCA